MPALCIRIYKAQFPRRETAIPRWNTISTTKLRSDSECCNRPNSGARCLAAVPGPRVLPADAHFKMQTRVRLKRAETEPLMTGCGT